MTPKRNAAFENASLSSQYYRKRLLLDACQFVRSQSFVASRFGRPFRPSRDFVEIDITCACNLKCINCNRSCAQAPSDIEMPVVDIEAFIKQTIEKEITWKRIRILGGEPTLHGRIFDIIDLLIDYQRAYNSAVRLVLGTNFFGADVHRVLEKLPAAITLNKYAEVFALLHVCRGRWH